MSATTLTPRTSELTAGQLPRFTAIAMLVVAVAITAGVLSLFSAAGVGNVAIISVLVFLAATFGTYGLVRKQVRKSRRALGN